VVVDAFTDLLHELVVHRGGSPSLELVLRRGEERLFERYWLPRLEAGGVGIQLGPNDGASLPRETVRERALAQADEVVRLVRANGDRVCHARTRAELDDPRLRLVLTLEGVTLLEGDPGAFDEWYERGVRVASLTWNHANDFAGGIATPEQGLTSRGRALVRRFRELGVVLDLAHASERTWRDVLEEDVAVVVTHAGCRGVHDHPRNLADWQLEALRERGGVLGVMGLALAVGPGATRSRFADHVDHAVSVMGVGHVGFGGDFVERVSHDAEKDRLGVAGFAGPEDYPALLAELRRRGYEGARLAALASGNWLRILRAAPGTGAPADTSRYDA
jgi:membrane dipeptidase